MSDNWDTEETERIIMNDEGLYDMGVELTHGTAFKADLAESLQSNMESLVKDLPYSNVDLKAIDWLEIADSFMSMEEESSITHYIEAGSTSTGTRKLEDLVAGIEHLKEHDTLLNELIDDFEAEDDDELKEWIADEIFDRLNEVAPTNLIFGAHPADGADYGFWEIEDEIKSE